MYFAAVRSSDPSSFQEILQTHPYHIDSLLQLAEVCNKIGESDLAKDLIERAIYAVELALHPMFDPLNANCRMLFSVEENK
jgi:hypothetical protein